MDSSHAHSKENQSMLRDGSSNTTISLGNDDDDDDDDGSKAYIQ